MIKDLGIVTIIVALCLKCVTSHGGHSEDLNTKNAIQDALLSYRCRGANGFPCNGHGYCSSGMCTCYAGYSGLKCENSGSGLDIFATATEDTLVGNNNVGGLNLHDLLSTDSNEPQILACVNNNENTCNGNGICQEGSCICEPGYSGLTCELSHEVGFCQTYKECAECTAFMNPCPDKCSMIANFKLVFGFPKSSDTFRKCRFRNSDHNCTFYFKEESETPQGWKTIMVKACLAYQESSTNSNETLEQLKDSPLQPETSSKSPTSSSDSSAGVVKEDPHKGHDHGSSGDTGKPDSFSGDSGTSLLKPEVLFVIGSIALTLRL